MLKLLTKPAFLHPKYWLTWIGLLIFRVLVMLPHPLRVIVGESLGKLTYQIAKRRRHIVEINLQLCFPDKTPDELINLTQETFKSGGISIIETGFAWLRGPDSILGRVEIEGLDILRGAQAQGKGVILMGMHLSTLDICGAALGRYVPFDVMYRRNKNLLLEAIMTNGREQNFPEAIERNDIRRVIHNLKQGHIVWYGPDQDYGRRNAIFSSFFGVPAATITATSRIAKITGSPVVSYSHFRNIKTGKYTIRIEGPIEHFPSASDTEDVNKINCLLEQAIAKAPEQYWWFHRRFKTRPNKNDDVY
ncbi:MAG: KDO2-lipid IV(A) lauroyltransferase [Candidatus Azotimanducaceae bacterium]|jgi:KDO2-lipid IV(A) lauroyltransferase